MQRAICSIDDIRYFIDSDKTHEKAYRMIEEFYDVILHDFTIDEIIEESKVNPFIKKLLKRENASIYFVENLSNEIQNAEYDKFLNDILILNDKKYVESIRNEFGILAFNKEDDFLENNSINIRFDLENENYDKFKSWTDLFETEKINPLNSAILIDNYLWNNLDDFAKENESNLYEIIASIIPKGLIIPFHLMIVVQNKDGRYTPNWLAPKVNKICKRIKKDTGKDIEVGIMTQTDTKVFHKRVLITNHHYMYSDSGFTIYDGKKVIKITDGIREFVFKDIDSYKGDPLKLKHVKVVKRVKKALDYLNSLRPNNTVFSVGNTKSPLLS